MEKSLKFKYYSLLHKVLIKYNKWRFKNFIKKWFWYKLWKHLNNNYYGLIEFKLHGEKVLLNNGNPYPLFYYTFPNYNKPLIEVINQLYNLNKRKINYIDIGAATGDTLLFVQEKCPNMLGDFFCIEGDNDFYQILKLNLNRFNNGKLLNVMLSDSSGKKIKSLIKTHKGTASSQGTNYVNSTTIDEILSKENIKIDLIKIDVDGLDGQIINGALNTLSNQHTTVIFEWHPILYNQTQNSIYLPFDLLKFNGYDKFVFFDKYGNFSQFHLNISIEEIEILNKFCCDEKYDKEPHFDVIAIHNSINIDLNNLCLLNYSNKIN